MGVELGRGADPNRGDRFSEADQHELAVALGEVGDRHLLQATQLPAAHEPRAAVVDDRGDDPQGRPRSGAEHRADDQQRHPDQDGDRESHDRAPRSGAATRGLRVQRQMDQPDDCVGGGKQQRAVLERARNRQTGEKDEHQRDEQRAAQQPVVVVERIRHPDERRPCPPDQRQHEHRAPETGPGGVMRKQPDHLRDRKREHQVPQQLHRAGTPLAGDRAGGGRRRVGLERRVRGGSHGWQRTISRRARPPR